MSAARSRKRALRARSCARSASIVLSSIHAIAASSPASPNRVVAAGLELVRHERRLNGPVADGPRTTLHQGFQRRLEARPNIERAGPQGAHQALVAWRGEQIDARRLHVDRYMSDGLRRIDEQRDAAPPGFAADGFDCLERAGDIAAVDDRNQARLRTDRVEQGVHIDKSRGRVGLDVGGLNPPGGRQGVQRPQHGVVLHRRRHNMVALTEMALDGLVERGGTVHREDDMLGRFCMDKPREAAAATGQNLAGLDRFSIGSTARRGPQTLRVGPHGLEDLGRLGKTRGGVVGVQS